MKSKPRITYSPELVKFLKAWKCWRVFKENCEKSEWENDGYFVHSVWSGFPWVRSEQGLRFWQAINEMYMYNA